MIVKNTHEIVNSEKFRKLVITRWTVSVLLTFILFVIYFGYIGIAAYYDEILKIKVGGSANVGIIMGFGVLIGSWVLTAVYTLWANKSFDKKADELKKELKY